MVRGRVIDHEYTNSDRRFREHAVDTGTEVAGIVIARYHDVNRAHGAHLLGNSNDPLFNTGLDAPLC
jgi:hypothetical protein